MEEANKAVEVKLHLYYYSFFIGVTLYKFQVYTIIFHLPYRYVVFPSKSLISTHHCIHVPLYPFRPSITPFPSGNYQSIFCIYVFVFVVSMLVTTALTLRLCGWIA